MKTFNEFKLNENLGQLWATVSIDKKGSIVITSKPVVIEQAASLINTASKGEILAIMSVDEIKNAAKSRTVIGLEYL